MGGALLVGISGALTTLVGAATDGKPVPEPAIILVLATLLAFDIFAVLAGGYIKISARRQAAKWLDQAIGDMRMVALIWGLDAGLGLATYRVTSGLFVAIAVDALLWQNLAVPVATVTYAAAFCLAMMVSLRRTSAARRSGAFSEYVESLILRRGLVQRTYLGTAILGLILVGF